VIPRFFGAAPDRALFGVYHPPSGEVARSAAVLLCNPGPQEQYQTHFAYVKLARMLARQGVHVLRFDYFGTGDSAGSTREATLEDWIADIDTAATELRDLSGTRRVAVMASRLGAILALRAIRNGLRATSTVLWDPIASGAEYLATLHAAQQRLLDGLTYPEDNTRPSDELLGYPMPASMRTAILGARLLDELREAPANLAVVAGHPNAAPNELVHFLGADRVSLVQDVSLAAGGWQFDTMLAHSVLNTVCERLSVRPV
jgi:pimeloyl-ACP methyl ester carboxylesterase